ncbi:dTDP-4-dehydrorhamnose 3,5-epimerase [Geobacter argillaceus]|uniref:dTDP-4-dehydrorhamnose 3,5-epimerase n=1 Tax=Geobacter argillaceus TaxID=345631 RepID=A0A562WR50_9BACT|nr:dTDP-4-dehydrorhamnose 3,5-epimerase [Geobacter argillaceus]TWJ32601.1 dTDP-4-dehydrorhamnose 3,5-epimerase [Geobacter argillaceus]
MIFRETPLAGSFLISPERREDERGYFARTFCVEEFAARSLPTEVQQCNVSFNRLQGTVRGMHFQKAPKAEAKLVRCTRGAIFDIMVDLRPESTTFCQWYGAELTVGNGDALFIPEGFAHGFQTLEDGTEVFYQMFALYSPEYAAGVCWDDPAFGISWPLPVSVVAPKDCSYPAYRKVGV